MTPEEETLKKIKYVLSCGNDAQAVRLIEQYGHWKQEQTEQLPINGVVINEATKGHTITLEVNKPVVSKLSDWEEKSEVELCDNPNCEDGIVDYDYYKNPIYCQVCDKHN